MLKGLFSSKKLKEYRSFIEEHLNSIAKDPPYIGLSDDYLLNEVEKAAIKLSHHSNMKKNFDSDDDLDPSFQALHTIFDAIYEMLYREPLVDAGTGNDGQRKYCSVNLRDPLGRINDEGRYLRYLAKEIIKRIVSYGYAKPDSEYVINLNHVIDDATRF